MQSKLDKFKTIDHNPKIGVYILLNGPEVVYIGKSIDVHSRISSHRNNGFEFDGVKFIEILNAKDRGLKEIELIWEYKPKYNINITDPQEYLKRKKKPTINPKPKNKFKPQNILKNINVRKLKKKPQKRRQPLDPRLERILSTSKNTEAVLKRFSYREQDIIKRRYGLLGNEKESLESIAPDHGVTKERIRQIQRAIERKLRHRATTRHLLQD